MCLAALVEASYSRFSGGPCACILIGVQYRSGPPYLVHGLGTWYHMYVIMSMFVKSTVHMTPSNFQVYNQPRWEWSTGPVRFGQL